MGNKNSILFRYCQVIFYLVLLNKAEKYVFLHRIWNWCSRFRHRCGYEYTLRLIFSDYFCCL